MSTYKEKAHNSKTFCIYPFVAVSTTPTGNIKPCCRAYDNGIGNINNNSLKEIWNNDSFKNEKISNDYLFEKDDFQSVKQVLHKPIFMGMDKKKQPFKVMARKATRLKESPDIFDLERPTGELKSGTEKFFVKGDEGIFYKDVQQLKIKGNVQFNDEKSMIFNTSEMYFDFKKEILTGDQKVKGKNATARPLTMCRTTNSKMEAAEAAQDEEVRRKQKFPVVHARKVNHQNPAKDPNQK